MGHFGPLNDPPGPLGAKMTEEMAKSRISAPLNGVWGVPEGPKGVVLTPFLDPFWDPSWPGLGGENGQNHLSEGSFWDPQNDPF